MSFRNKILHLLKVLSLFGIVTSCSFTRFVIYNYDDIRDYKKFPGRPLTSSSVKYIFPSSETGKAMPEFQSRDGKMLSFEEFMDEQKTVAFLVIRHDSVKYENYFHGYDRSSLVPSFSVSKSVLSILTGCAIDDGLIKSVKEPVTDYLPELKENGFQKVTIENLLQMTSGIDYNEGNLFALGKVYYGRNEWKIISKLELGKEPGTEFKYLNVNGQLLGFVLERALGGKTITQYMQEKLWQPLGMEYDASWSTDRKKNGIEKTFCCINAVARDYAKIGRLYLDKGIWNGRQIVSEDWVTNSLKIDTANGSAWNYQYMWWLPTQNGDFMAAGKRGQFVYVNPSKDLIIVRLGKDTGEVNWGGFFVQMAAGF